MEEMWKEIPGFDGRYLASSLGKIKSITRKVQDKRGKYKGRIQTVFGREMGFWYNKDYPYIELSKDGEATTYLVSRLILETFIGPCPEGMEACHFPDKSPRNVSLNNLRWDTRKGNCADKEVHGTTGRGIPRNVGEKNPNRVLTEDLVRQMRGLFGLGYTIKEVANRLI